MSDPYSAFLKFAIDRADLIAWLDDRPPLASAWTDWRNVGGNWYFDGGPRDIAEISDAELNEKVAVSDTRLRAFPSNRAAIRELLESAEMPALTRIAYDPQLREFIAGTLLYSENLMDLIVFLTIARGAAKRFRPDDCGTVSIDDFVMRGADQNSSIVSLRLGPGKSEFMAASELASAASAFRPIADEMLSSDDPLQTRNDLETLK